MMQNSSTAPDTAARTLRQTGSFFDHILRRDGFGQDIAGDAVRSGRVEAVAAEKRARLGFGDDAAVEEQGAAVGVFRAELNVVADH